MDLASRTSRAPGGVRQIHTTIPVARKDASTSTEIIQPSDFLAKFSQQDPSQGEKWSGKPNRPADSKNGIIQPEDFLAKFAHQNASQGKEWISRPNRPADSKNGIVQPEDFLAKFARQDASRGRKESSKANRSAYSKNGVVHPEDFLAKFAQLDTSQGKERISKPNKSASSNSGIVQPEDFLAKFAQQDAFRGERRKRKSMTISDRNSLSEADIVQHSDFADGSLQTETPQISNSAPRQPRPAEGPIKSSFVWNQLQHPKPIQFHPLIQPHGDATPAPQASLGPHDALVAKPFGFALSHDHDFLASRRQSFRQLPENEGWRRGKGYMPQLSDQLREAKNLLEVKPTERSRLLLTDRMIYPGVGTSATRSGPLESALSTSMDRPLAEGPLGRLGNDMASEQRTPEVNSSEIELIRQTPDISAPTELQRFEVGEVYADHYNRKHPGLSRSQVENYRMEGSYVATQLLTSILASHQSLLLPKVAEVLSKLRESGMDPGSAILMEPKRRASDIMDVCITGKLPTSFFEEVLLTLVHPEEDWLGVIPSFLQKVKVKPTEHTTRLMETMFRAFAQPQWSGIWRSGQLVSDFVDFWADDVEASERLAELLTNRRFGRSLGVPVEVEQRLQGNLTFLRGLRIPENGGTQPLPDVYQSHLQALREARLEEWDAVWATLAQGATALGDKSDPKCLIVGQQIADLFVAGHTVEDIASSLPRLRELTVFGLRHEWVVSVLDLYGRQLSADGYFAWLDFCSSSKFSMNSSFVSAMCKNLSTYWLASPKAMEDMRLAVDAFMPPDRGLKVSDAQTRDFKSLRRKGKAGNWIEAIEIFQNSIDTVSYPVDHEFLHKNLHEIVGAYLGLEGPESDALHNLIGRFAAEGHDMAQYCTRVALAQVSSGSDPKLVRDQFVARGFQLGGAFYNTVVQGLINDSLASKALGWCMLWASDYGTENLAHDTLSFPSVTRALTVMDTKAAYLELDRILAEFLREPQWWHASDPVYYSIKRNIKTVARRVAEKDPWQEAMLVRLDQVLVEASKRRYVRRRDRPTIIRKFVDHVLFNPPDWPDKHQTPQKPAAKVEVAAARNPPPPGNDTGYFARMLSGAQVGVSG